MINILEPISFVFSREAYEKPKSIVSDWEDNDHKLQWIWKYEIKVHPVTHEMEISLPMLEIKLPLKAVFVLQKLVTVWSQPENLGTMLD